MDFVVGMCEINDDFVVIALQFGLGFDELGDLLGYHKGPSLHVLGFHVAKVGFVKDVVGSVFIALVIEEFPPQIPAEVYETNNRKHASKA